MDLLDSVANEQKNDFDPNGPFTYLVNDRDGEIDCLLIPAHRLIQDLSGLPRPEPRFREIEQSPKERADQLESFMGTLFSLIDQYRGEDGFILCDDELIIEIWDIRIEAPYRLSGFDIDELVRQVMKSLSYSDEAAAQELVCFGVLTYWCQELDISCPALVEI